MDNQYTKKIKSLSEEISLRGDVWELYYERGYYFFLNDDLKSAKDDYLQAVKFGLDITQVPFYTFSNENSKRREFILPEKIMVILILLMVVFSTILQVSDFFIKNNLFIP